MMKSSNFDGLSSIHSPPSSIFNSKCFILHAPSSNLLDPNLHLRLFFLHPPYLLDPSIIFNSSSSILSQKNGIFDSKSPQNSVISNKMSASTACSFFQVCRGQTFLTHNGGTNISTSRGGATFYVGGGGGYGNERSRHAPSNIKCNFLCHVVCKNKPQDFGEMANQGLML